ncbi:MAG: hypothetical protein EXS08_08665 [Planctomycetes bacterium]|nr:hypothetical protein [Planctomycetota bacterium]
MKSQSKARSRAGFSMTELVISAMLMGSLMLVAGLATDRAMSLFRQRRASEEVSSSASRLLQRVTNALAFARRTSLTPVPNAPQGGSTLTFNTCRGVEAGVVQWSAPITLCWEREDGELNDGLDNNGNGLVDEGQLAWIENLGLAGEKRVVWGHGLCEFLPGETFDGADEDGDGLIDEAGLSFEIQGDVLTVQLGLQGSGPDGNIMTRVVETSVLVRN